MKYFTELLEINKRFIKEDNNVRLTNLDEIYQKLDQFYSIPFDLDQFIKLCIALFNMQIFYDGNSRTIFSYLNMVLDRYGYYINTDEAIKDLMEFRNMFPVMYDLDEIINDSMVLKIKQYILKKEVRNKRSI